MDKQVTFPLPKWVPDHAQRYLEHTEAGRPIRDLAREAGVHASTVLRQVRRLESRRDDPLVDAALADLALAHFPPAVRRGPTSGQAGNSQEEKMTKTSSTPDAETSPDSVTLAREACRVLRRLCENGAVLAVADKMEKAVVVRDGGAGDAGARTAVVDCSIARAMALKDWISCTVPGRISRYRITAAGRSALSRMLAAQENRARAGSEQGFAEAQAPFGNPPCGSGVDDVREAPRGPSRRPRYNMAESPLAALARRKDRDGKPFLEDGLVHAGERLREDFELSQMGPNVTQNWDHFMAPGARGGGSPDSGVGNGASDARDRVARALSDLGPGLSDVALRCCCYLEGLETAEKRMGWSARSGKIVLRIALQRLRQHYESGPDADRMIG